MVGVIGEVTLVSASVVSGFLGLGVVGVVGGESTASSLTGAALGESGYIKCK